MWRLPGRSIADALRADRLLLVGFIALSLTALAPLGLGPFVPSPDLPGNVASATLLYDTALRRGMASQFYQVVWQPLPYWTCYLFMGAVGVVAGPVAAAKAIVGVCVLALPLGVLRLLLALGREPRLALWAFALSWEHNLLAGWHSYVLAMPIALVVLARMVEATSWRQALRRAGPWALLLALTHVLALAFVGVAAVMLAGRSRARWAASVAALSPSALVLAPWLGGRVIERLRAPTRLPVRVDFPWLSERVTRFYAFSLDNFTGPLAENASALAFGVLLLGPLGLSQSLPRPDADTHRHDGSLVALAALLLYVTVPMAVFGLVDHWYTYPRYASYVLAALLLVPGGQLRGRRAWWLLPGVAAALLCHLSAARACARFGERTRPLLAILEAVPPGARLLPLEYVTRDPIVRAAPLGHMHSYLTAARQAYDPHLYDNPSTPIRYRLDRPQPPRIPWDGPGVVSLALYGPHYDHVLVQGLDHDPFVANPDGGDFHVRLLRESGMWRLYALERVPLRWQVVARRRAARTRWLCRRRGTRCGPGRAPRSSRGGGLVSRRPWPGPRGRGLRVPHRGGRRPRGLPCHRGRVDASGRGAGRAAPRQPLRRRRRAPGRQGELRPDARAGRLARSLGAWRAAPRAACGRGRGHPPRLPAPVRAGPRAPSRRGRGPGDLGLAAPHG